MIRTALGTAVVLALGTLAHLAGENARASQVLEKHGEDLMYLPEGRFLRLASFGHRRFVADLVWLAAIQYYGEQKLTGQNHEQAERLFQVIYDVDPHFRGATRFGALVLAQDAGRPEAAIALLERAGKDHPEVWEYPFDRGFVHHAVRRDYAAAGAAYREASELPGAPDLAARLAGLSFARLGDRESSREVWGELLAEAGQNELLAQIARRNLSNLDMEDAQDLLSDAVSRFRENNGRTPRDWRELLAGGYVEAIPADPFGGMFYHDDETGRVWSTTHVDRIMSSTRGRFQVLVQETLKSDGRYPESLDVLVEWGLVRFPPWRPFGQALSYDPATGLVSWNPPWPEVEPGKHGGGGTS